MLKMDLFFWYASHSNDVRIYLVHEPWHGSCYMGNAHVGMGTAVYGMSMVGTDYATKKVLGGATFLLTEGTKIWYNRGLNLFGRGGRTPKIFFKIFL